MSGTVTNIRRKIVTLAVTTLALGGLGAGLAPTAGAETLPQLPEHEQPSPIWREDVTAVATVYSPYRGKVVCDGFHWQTTECWQQRPDGQWQTMTDIRTTAELSQSWQTVPPRLVYPIWEPGALVVPEGSQGSLGSLGSLGSP